MDDGSALWSGSDGPQPGVRSGAGCCREKPVLLELTEEGVEGEGGIREMEGGGGEMEGGTVKARRVRDNEAEVQEGRK